jgi:hypothetical protein
MGGMCGMNKKTDKRRRERKNSDGEEVMAQL